MYKFPLKEAGSYGPQRLTWTHLSFLDIEHSSLCCMTLICLLLTHGSQTHDSKASVCSATSYSDFSEFDFWAVDDFSILICLLIYISLTMSFKSSIYCEASSIHLWLTWLKHWCQSCVISLEAFRKIDYSWVDIIAPILICFNTNRFYTRWALAISLSSSFKIMCLSLSW